ncbi:TVB72 protein, partial [Halcyon senegalensis]|nr:TVB72 protein [Halcyon senegalensis]
GGASAEGKRVQQSPEQLWVLPGEAAELNCPISHHRSAVDWYKEKPDGGLYWIYRSSDYSPPSGRYSGRVETGGNVSLTISSTRREDSGVYFCSLSTFSPQFGDGTRLIVTDATEPELSILVPVDTAEPGQPPAAIPLLCHLRDVPRGWDTVSWQPGGDVARVTRVTALDEHGVLNAWSIAWVSAERW